MENVDRDGKRGLGLYRVRTHLKDEYRMARSGNAALRLVRYAYRKAGCAPRYMAGWTADVCEWADTAREVAQ